MFNLHSFNYHITHLEPLKRLADEKDAINRFIYASERQLAVHSDVGRLSEMVKNTFVSELPPKRGDPAQPAGSSCDAISSCFSSLLVRPVLGSCGRHSSSVQPSEQGTVGKHMPQLTMGFN